MNSTHAAMRRATLTSPAAEGRCRRAALSETLMRRARPDWVRFVIEVPGVSYETLRKRCSFSLHLVTSISHDRFGPSLARLLIDSGYATALNIEPTVFIEYRLLHARRELDPLEVGWQRAAEALRSWEERKRLKD